MVNMKPVYITG